MSRFPFGYSFCFRWWDAETIADDGLKGDFVEVGGCKDYLKYKGGYNESLIS